MRRIFGILGSFVGLIVIGLLLAGLIWVFSGQFGAGGQPQVAQQPYPPPQTPTPGAYPPPKPTIPQEPLPTFTPLPPTPTIPPVPTPLPTPVVTVVPTAEPPIIPVPPGQAEPYTLVFRDDHVIRAINSDGTNQRTLVDIRAQLSLYLASKRIGGAPFAWGKPSPDGSHVALVLSNTERDFPRKGELPEYSIYLLDVETKRSQLLVRDGAAPAWSPDGTRIAYRNTQTGGLWIADITTGEAREIYATDRSVNFLTWSPDGQKIAFVDGNIGAIWVTDATGQGEAVQLVPREMYAGYLNWSPAGDQILFISDSGEHVTSERPLSLWTINVDTGERQQLTQNITISGGTPEWSMDSQWIVFAGTNLLEGRGFPYDLWLVSRDGSQLKRLTNDPASDLYPSWVTASKVVFLKRDAGIWEMDLRDGTFRRVLSQDVEYTVLK